MKIFRFARTLCVSALVAGAISTASSSEKEKRAPVLMPGLGDVHHPVSTKNSQAQQFFDQGLKLVFGFNHDEARRSFQRAAELDPKLAMAWWGVALTLGPNYNLPVDPEREKAGYEAAQRALALQENASEPEKGYINAVVVRYSNDPKADLPALDVAYKEAMGKLAARYPDDLDAATLYAESAMNLHPWHLWMPDGKPNAGTEEIVSVLESVLKRDPNHLRGESLLHPRGRSVAAAGAGLAERESLDKTRAGRRTSGAHAGAYLCARGRSRGLRALQ